MAGATCVIGQGVVFDGTDDYVDMVDVELGGPMTVAAWARWDERRDASRIFDAGNWHQDNIILAEHTTTTQIYYGNMVNGRHDWAIEDAPGSIVIGGWLHVV